ncbi:hypothetical protein AURDEDRAFT_163137 [Auricularia subglabra TFB-10046 SS5]|nr:hypothetical protein AURDEDRAFT_163137 [Auricularia subglabra TFB-10046 SS5]
MSVQSNDVEDAGTIMHWVLHGGSDVRACTWVDWNAGEKITKATDKLCMCTVLRVPDSCIPWADFTDPEDGRVPRTGVAADLPKGSPIRALMWTLLLECVNVHCPNGIISDSTGTLFVKWDSACGFAGVPSAVWYEAIPATSHSTLYCIAAAVSFHGASLGPPSLSRRVFGASNSSNAGVLSEDAPPKRFRDFGLYEMEHGQQLYEEFLRWKVVQFQAAISAPLEPGADLPLEPDVFSRLLQPRRCPFDWVPVPEDCITSIFERRPRCSCVDELLRSGAPLAFRLKKNLRPPGTATSAELAEDPGEAVDTELCLKLLDERLFPVPTLREYLENNPPQSRLGELAIAEEMLSHEEAVYFRFSGGTPERPEKCPNLQGLMLPHCYGFHEFTVNDETGSRPVLGILLELIDGVHLGSIVEEMLVEESSSISDEEEVLEFDQGEYLDPSIHDPAEDSSSTQVKEASTHWTHAEKLALLKRVRNCVSVLNHAHISQGDWHANQFLCIRRDNPDLPRDANIDLVLVDFAFAQHFNDVHNSVPELDDVGRLFSTLTELGLSPLLLHEVGWGKRDEWEV